MNKRFDCVAEATHFDDASVQQTQANGPITSFIFDPCTALPDYCVFVRHHNLSVSWSEMIIDLNTAGVSELYPAFEDDLTNQCTPYG